LVVPSTGVNAQEIGNQLGQAVGPFLLAGVGVAIAVFIVRAGWTWIKSLGRG
jgi:Ca2+/H+ antiporter